MIYTTYYARIKTLPADITPIAISNTVPIGISILHMPILAPSWAVINNYKEYGNRAEFRRQYLQALERLNAKNIISQFPSGDVALVCYEKNSEACHRSILAEWLYDKLRLEVEEWEGYR